MLAQIWTGRRPAGPDDKYLFLDEPTASLDIHYQIHLLDVARGLLPGGCTVVAILHDLNVALQHGDAFIVLQGGRLAQEVDRAEDVSQELVERVFRVQARRVSDPESHDQFWRFALDARDNPLPPAKTV